MAAGCVIAKRRNLISKAVLGTVILVLMLLMLLKPDEYIKAAADGIKLFCVSVLPAMFPFVFFSQILILCGMQESFSKPFTRPVKFLFNSPPEGAFIMVMSFISGYPIGAKLCADLYNKGVLSKEDVKNIIPFASTSGPIFIVGTLGYALFNNYTAGIVILSAHILGAIINGIVWSFFSGVQKKDAAPAAVIKPVISPQDTNGALSKAVQGSLLATLSVGGYITVFNIAATAIKNGGVVSFLGALLGKVGAPSDVAEGVIFGIIEMTRGCLSLSVAAVPLSLKVVCASAIISLGGLGIAIQSISFLSPCGIRTGDYVSRKLTQTVISLAVVCAFIPLL